MMTDVTLTTVILVFFVPWDIARDTDSSRLFANFNPCYY